MPILSRPTIIVVCSIYLLIVLVIGAWASRRTRSTKDFFIAGQGIGLLVTGLATMSAAFSGFVFIGGPGLTYRLGIGSLFISIPVSFTAGLLCWVVARRLRLLTEVREVYTIPDAIDARFRSRGAAGAAALAILVGTVGYLGSQVLALGKLIEAIFGTEALLGPASLPVAMALGALMVLLYAVPGGMVAGVYTDLFQGTLMVLTAFGIFGYAIYSGGGVSAITTSIASSERFGPGFIEPFGVLPILSAIGFFFIFAIGNLGQPHMLHKFYMLDDPLKLRFMPLVVGLGQTLCVFIWLGIGLAVPGLVSLGRLAPLSDPDHATPEFLLHFTPELLAGLVFGGILAAIMSTADSFVNIGSAALMRDLPRALGMRTGDRELRAARLATVGIMVAAGLLAWSYGDLIALLGTFAFGTFGAALAPVMAVGLNWKGVTRQAALWSIWMGLVSNLGLEFLVKQDMISWLPRPPLPTGALPAAVSLALSFSTLFVVSWLTRNAREDLDEDMAAVIDC